MLSPNFYWGWYSHYLEILIILCNSFNPLLFVTSRNEYFTLVQFRLFFDHPLINSNIENLEFLSKTLNFNDYDDFNLKYQES